MLNKLFVQSGKKAYQSFTSSSVSLYRNFILLASEVYRHFWLISYKYITTAQQIKVRIGKNFILGKKPLF
jgi:hypothetical protein